MFANPNNNSAAVNNNAGNGRDFEKAVGFFNFYLPTTGGGRAKLGSIALRDSDKVQKAVLNKLAAAKTEDEFAEALGGLFGKMQLEYNAAEGKAVELDI